MVRGRGRDTGAYHQRPEAGPWAGTASRLHTTSLGRKWPERRPHDRSRKVNEGQTLGTMVGTATAPIPFVVVGPIFAGGGTTEPAGGGCSTPSNARTIVKTGQRSSGLVGRKGRSPEGNERSARFGSPVEDPGTGQVGHVGRQGRGGRTMSNPPSGSPEKPGGETGPGPHVSVLGPVGTAPIWSGSPPLPPTVGKEELGPLCNPTTIGAVESVPWRGVGRARGAGTFVACVVGHGRVGRPTWANGISCWSSCEARSCRGVARFYVIAGSATG